MHIHTIDSLCRTLCAFLACESTISPTMQLLQSNVAEEMRFVRGPRAGSSSIKNHYQTTCLKTCARVKRWERVGWKLEQRRGDQRLITTTVVACFEEVCRRHVPSPVHAKQRYKSIATGSQRQKKYYKFNSCLRYILLGYRPILFLNAA
jgi:hypothetical protein